MKVIDFYILMNNALTSILCYNLFHIYFSKFIKLFTIHILLYTAKFLKVCNRHFAIIIHNYNN